MRRRIKFNLEKHTSTVSYVLDRVQPRRHCNKCNSIVLKSDVKGYKYQCLNCDEDLYSIETKLGKLQTIEDLTKLFIKANELFCLDNGGETTNV